MNKILLFLLEVCALVIVSSITILLAKDNYNAISWCGGAIALGTMMVIKELGE